MARTNNVAKYILDKEWKYTPEGILFKRYTDILTRVNGKRSDGNMLWYGLPVVTRQEFITWGLQNPDFQRLYKEWIDAGRPMLLAPSIDRLDSHPAAEDGPGYVIGNMKWLTYHEHMKEEGKKKKARNRAKKEAERLTQP